MHKKFNDKIRQSYDAIADTWNEQREWYIEQSSVDAAIEHLLTQASLLIALIPSLMNTPLNQRCLVNGFVIVDVLHP